MTGLDVEKDRILEVACVITDENLKTVSDEFHIVVHQPDRMLDHMNEWCTKTHSKVAHNLLLLLLFLMKIFSRDI